MPMDLSKQHFKLYPDLHGGRPVRAALAAAAVRQAGVGDGRDAHRAVQGVPLRAEEPHPGGHGPTQGEILV